MAEGWGYIKFRSCVTEKMQSEHGWRSNQTFSLYKISDENKLNNNITES